MKVVIYGYGSNIFFSRTFFKVNMNPPAHFATQTLVLFSRSEFHSSWGSFLASHLPTSPTLLHLQDSWKLAKENFCLRLQIPVLSVPF